MASKAIYTVVAVIGIAAASGAAWWFQRPASKGVPAELGAAGAGAPSPAGAGSAAGPARPPTVEVAKVVATRVVDDTQTVGSLRSRQSVVLRPEVSGRITQLNFRDGDRVRKGQVLVQFDDQLQQAQLQQSLAELSIATANHKRNQDLVAQNFISQRSVDESAANLQVADAKLALARATAARLKIVAPFDGMTGIRSVNVGDYLKDGADIVNVEDLEAIYVDFRLPERFQTKVQRGQRATIDIDALPGRKFSAVVLAIDPLLDANGRSIGVRGCIDNRQLQLRPGMFARVGAVFGERDGVLVVPEESLVPQGNRQFVLKLMPGPGAESVVTQRVEVKVGVRRPGQVEIMEGLAEGDRVVTAGQQRVQRDGTAVKVVEVGRGAGAANGTAAAPARAGSAPVAASPAVAAVATAAKETVGAAGPSTAKQAPATVGQNPCLAIPVAAAGHAMPPAPARPAPASPRSPA